MKHKKNDKGFTLIEVCIAVAILAIALTPFIANFIQASKLNLKSRKNLNATTLAQDFYEGASVYSASQLNKMMSLAAADTANLSEVAKLFPVGTTITGVSGGAVAGKNNLYEYTISGIQTTDGTYNTYDLEVTLDGRETDDTGAAVAGKYAEKEYANIDKIDAYYDATYTMDSGELASAIAKIKETGVPDAEYEGKLKRTMKVYIRNTTGDPRNPNFEVVVDRVYEVAEAADKPRLGDRAITLQGSNLSKRNSNELPRSLYIYFTGMQNAKSTNDYETIEIYNTSGRNITVYLIRTQQETDAITAAQYNNDYGCTVRVFSQEQEVLDNEGNATGEKMGETYLVSNLRYNLSEAAEKNFRVYEENSGTLLSNVVSTQADADAKPDKEYKVYKVASESRYNAARAKYFYDSTGTGTMLMQMDEATYKRIVSDGYQKKENATLLFHLNIEIYESGTSNKVAEYTGGVVD